MKSFPTVVLLVMGLIGTCTARTIDVDNDRKRQIRTTCYEKTGSNQAFDAMISSYAVVQKCFLMKWTVQPKDLRITFFNCPYVINAFQCLQSAVRQLSECLGDNAFQRGLDSDLEVASKYIPVSCVENMEKLPEENVDLDVCIKTYSNYSEECPKDALEVYYDSMAWRAYLPKELLPDDETSNNIDSKWQAEPPTEIPSAADFFKDMKMITFPPVRIMATNYGFSSVGRVQTPKIHWLSLCVLALVLMNSLGM